jgi:hypothetical protein
MSVTNLHPRATDLGEPQRRWHITPREIPVPTPAPAHRETPTPAAEPTREPERVA